MKDVTFGITHYLRPDDLRDCVASIRRHFPDAAIDAEDTRGNLSAGRNRLVARCRTPYFFLIEEDMRVTPQTNVAAMRRILEQRPDVIGVGGAIFEPAKGIRCIASQYRRTNAAIVLEDAVDRRTTREGDAFIVCSLIYNYGLFRTSDLRRYQWNEQLPLAEHYEFFFRIQERGRHRIACCHSVIDHLNTRPNPEYRKARKRIHLFRHHERRIMKRRLVRNFSEHLLHSSPLFRCVVVGGDRRSAKIATSGFPGFFCSSPAADALIDDLPDTPGRWRNTLRGNGTWKLYVADMRKALHVARHFSSYRLPLLYLPATNAADAAYLAELLQTWPYSVIPINECRF